MGPSRRLILAISSRSVSNDAGEAWELVALELASVSRIWRSTSRPPRTVSDSQSWIMQIARLCGLGFNRGGGSYASSSIGSACGVAGDDYRISEKPCLPHMRTLSTSSLERGERQGSNTVMVITDRAPSPTSKYTLKAHRFVCIAQPSTLLGLGK